MRRRTRTGTWLGVLAGSALMGAVPAQAADLAPGFYKPAFTDTVTRVAVVDGGLTHHAVTYEEYQQAGFPAPQPSPTEHVKHTWSPYIAAVTSWPEGLQWDGLNGPMWQRAGSPTPRTAGYIGGTAVDQYPTSPEIIAAAPDGTRHELTPAGWAAMGSPAPTVHVHQRYYVRTWNPTVVCCSDAPGFEGCDAESYEYWTTEGQATPQRAQTARGDSFFSPRGSRDIFACGAGFDPALGHLMTPAEWGPPVRPSRRAPDAPTAPPTGLPCRVGRAGSPGMILAAGTGMMR